MPNLTEAVTEVEYNRAASDENYPVIFGLSYPDKILTDEGTRGDAHHDIFLLSDDEDELRWRYVPMTETIYWWATPDKETREKAKQLLKDKYGVVVSHEILLYQKMEDAKRKTLYMTGHHRHPNLKTVKRIPSFQNWYKAHQGD